FHDSDLMRRRKTAYPLANWVRSFHLFQQATMRFSYSSSDLGAYILIIECMNARQLPDHRQVQAPFDCEDGKARIGCCAPRQPAQQLCSIHFFKLLKKRYPVVLPVDVQREVTQQPNLSRHHV